MKKVFTYLPMWLAGLCCCTQTMAQSEFDYKQAFIELDTFIQQFVDYSDFREPMKESPSALSREQYIGLFKPGTYILDLYNPQRMDQKGQFMPVIPPTDLAFPPMRTIEDYVEDVSRFCTNGVGIKITGINADYSMIENGQVKMTMRRESTIRDYQEWRYMIVDEITLQLAWDASSKRYVITRMDVADNYVVSCSNCEDRFAARVDPADDPKNPLKLWAGLHGLAGVSSVTMADPQTAMLNAEVYNNLVASQSTLGTLSSAGVRPCWGIEGNAQLMKGYKHQWGVSLGFGLMNTRAEFSETTTALMYQSEDVVGSAYNRRVVLNDALVNVSMLTMYSPLQFHYTRRVSKKLKLHGALGAAVSFWGSATSRQSARADFEAGLKFTEPSDREVTTIYSANADFDVVMNEETLTDAQLQNLTALQHYDLAFNKDLTGETKFNTAFGLALTARAGAGWMVNSSTEVQVNAGLNAGNQQWSGNTVTLADKSTDVQELGSVVQGIGEWNAMQFLITGGVRFYLSSFKK